MDFKEYQAKAVSTAIYQGRGNNLAYPVLGLMGEVGELIEKVEPALAFYDPMTRRLLKLSWKASRIAEVVKRVFRGDREVNDDFRELVKKELGDVLWYIAAICSELGLDMDEVARLNTEKLASRKKRGKLHGQGDNR